MDPVPLRKPKVCPACLAEHKLARAQAEWEQGGWWTWLTTVSPRREAELDRKSALEVLEWTRKLGTEGSGGMYDSVVTLRARRGFNADGTPKHTCKKGTAVDNEYANPESELA